MRTTGGELTHARGVMHGDAAAKLHNGTDLCAEREFGDGANGRGCTGGEPRVESLVVEFAGDLIEHGDDAFGGAAGRGEPFSEQVVNGHVHACRPRLACRRGGIE